MKCSKCRNYSTKVRRCMKGVINPSTIKGGVDAARWFGMNYICGVDEENLRKKENIREKLMKESKG